MLTDLSTNLEAELYQAAMAAMNQVLEKYQGPAIMSQDEQKQIIVSAGNALDTSTLQQRKFVSRLADEVSQRETMQQFRDNKAANTLKAHDADLQRFKDWLIDHKFPVTGNMGEDPQQWQHMTFGLVQQFKQYAIEQGYAISSINRMLSTIRRYADLAHNSGVINSTDVLKIKAIPSISDKSKLDRNRAAEGIPTRRTIFVNAEGYEQKTAQKKPEPVKITPIQAQQLKLVHDDTDQGIRDRVLMGLLIDQGLRCGELVERDYGNRVSGILAENIDLSSGKMQFYRPKVDKWTEEPVSISPELLQALRLYRDYGLMPKSGNILRASVKGGRLTTQGMSERAITYRVKVLGKNILGIDNLSAHDCRHYWATDYVITQRELYENVDLLKLQEAGGWASLAMPMHYVNITADAMFRWTWRTGLDAKIVTRDA